MDWSPDSVLDFGPRVHRRGLRWTQRRLLLWPALAWRVVVPEEPERGLNPVQRAVLRLHQAGQRRYDEIGQSLALDRELVAFVAAELHDQELLDERGESTAKGHSTLEEAEPTLGEMQVGWVFQDASSERLMPRFVTELSVAQVEPDPEGRPRVTMGSKGRPFTERAFVLRPSREIAEVAPSPAEILDAARRHRRHVRRAKRARLEPGIDAPGAVDRVSLIDPWPERVHLLTFAYVPEEPDEEEPWFVAEPFGFGASPELRERLEQLRSRATGGLRVALDSITGQAREQHRRQWMEMNNLLRTEARTRVERVLPRGRLADDEPIRERLEKAWVDILRLEESEQARGRVRSTDVDAAYLHLRQAIEAGLVLLVTGHPPGDAWRKVDGLAGPDVGNTIERCAAAVGFTAEHLPRPVRRAGVRVLRSVCVYESGGRVRPTLAALILAAADLQDHPLREIAREAPRWLLDCNLVASAAGGEVHGDDVRRGLPELQRDAERTAAVLRVLINTIE
jgi:hypothetical protein